MEINVTQATEVGALIIFVLLFTLILNAFYPSDFSIFGNDILIEPIKFDEVTIAGWIAIIAVAGAIGFFTSGSAWDVAITGLFLAFLLLIYPIFVYMIDILTLGMFNYPAYDIHKETPIVLLLFIAIPSAFFFFYLIFDLVTSAFHASAGGD